MIIGYDRTPNAPVDRKVQSLMESVQLALNEHATDISQLSNKVDNLNETLLGSGNISVTSTPTASTISKFDTDAHMNSADMTSQEVSDFVDSLDAQGANLAEQIGLEIRSVSWSATVPANGSANTNLKTLIDADLPSGKRFLALAGFTTNDQSLLLVGAYYNSNSSYSLQARNISSSALTKNVTIFYLCASV